MTAIRRGGDRMTSLAFTVYGIAQQMGSKRAFVPKGWTRPVITDTNRNLKSWQQLVAEGANVALQRAEDRALITEGVRLTVSFYLPRPKTLPKRTTAHIKRPDLSKAIRGLEDALTGVVYRDDSQVCEIVAAKHYAVEGQPPRVDIRVDVTAGIHPIAVPASPLPLFERTPDGRTEHARNAVGW